MQYWIATPSVICAVDTPSKLNFINDRSINTCLLIPFNSKPPQACTFVMLVLSTLVRQLDIPVSQNWIGISTTTQARRVLTSQTPACFVALPCTPLCSASSKASASHKVFVSREVLVMITMNTLLGFALETTFVEPKASLLSPKPHDCPPALFVPSLPALGSNFTTWCLHLHRDCLRLSGPQNPKLRRFASFFLHTISLPTYSSHRNANASTSISQTSSVCKSQQYRRGPSSKCNGVILFECY